MRLRPLYLARRGRGRIDGGDGGVFRAASRVKRAAFVCGLLVVHSIFGIFEQVVFIRLIAPKGEICSGVRRIVSNIKSVIFIPSLFITSKGFTRTRPGEGYRRGNRRARLAAPRNWRAFCTRYLPRTDGTTLECLAKAD